MSVWLNGRNRAKRSSRKRVITFLNEERSAPDLRRLKLWNPVRRPNILTMTPRVLRIRFPHGLGIAHDPAPVPETGGNGHAIRWHLRSLDETFKSQLLPFHVQYLDQSIGLIAEHKQQ